MCGSPHNADFVALAVGRIPEAVPILVRITSPSGSVFNAVAIDNALKRHAGTVTVWTCGIAASAGSDVAMADDDIVMPENALPRAP